ncbi:MAG: DUF4139 domain-containing protein [Rhodanobacteraceae bacterium]
MYRYLLPTALIASLAASVSASASDNDLAITLYRRNSDALFDGGESALTEGYAIVHERRAFALDGSRQRVVIDGLPATLDAEAITVVLDGNARILARHVFTAGDGSQLVAHRGERIRVFAADGKPMVDGVLLGLNASDLEVRAPDGAVNYVHDYTRITFPDGGGQPGTTLQLIVADGGRTSHADLTYPASGLGWRAAYDAILQAGADCRLHLESLASIANHSGRDFRGAHLKLVAGEPNFAKPTAPQPVAMKARAYNAAPEALPEQGALGDYRVYAIDRTLDLPDASVSQVPLHAPQDLACTRTLLVDARGGNWTPPKPITADNGYQRNVSQATSRLAFTAPIDLPAGYLRVLTGEDRHSEFLGETRIDDTPRNRKVDFTLGTAFDVTATHERSIFNVDQAAREMSEGFRITLSNAGDSRRTITLREHPYRWRNWSLVSSSVKPTRQTPDLLEFQLDVPADGESVLDYTVHYQWTTADQ